MPYTIKKDADGRFCVYKEDDPDGKSYGCHDSREKAQAQMAAIMANEKAYRSHAGIVREHGRWAVYEFVPTGNGKTYYYGPGLLAPTTIEKAMQFSKDWNEKAGRVLNYRNAKRAVDAHKMLGEMIMEAKLDDMTEEEKTYVERMGMYYSQAETDYTTVSPKMGKQQCAGCRWFMPSGHSTAVNGLSPTACHIVESYPDAILPTGWCNQYTDKPDMTPEPLQVVIVENEYHEMMYFTPKRLNAVQRSLRRLQGKPIDSIQITKGEDGLRYAMMFSSNGYEDREQEHVATKALEEYVKACYDDNGWIGDNRLLLWHDKNLVIGDIICAELPHGFLFEIAKERATPIAKAAWDFWQSTPDLEWGTSLGFYALKTQDNVYERIRKVETSILPRSHAANLLTLSEVLPHDS